MTTLYIIGNGFDLHHKMPTSYRNYREYLLNNGIDIEPFDAACFPDSNWAHIEESFQNLFDLNTSEEGFHLNAYLMIPINGGDPKVLAVNGPQSVISIKSIDETMHSIAEVHNFIVDWIKTIDLPKPNNNIIFEEQALFLTFNYTTVLEEVYKIPSKSILHIHGKVGSNELIFGYSGNKKSIQTVNTTSFEIESINQLLDLTYKDISCIINNNQQFWEKLTNVDKIIIIGSSITGDAPYFEHIHNLTKHNLPRWILWAYTYDSDLFDTLFKIVGTFDVVAYPPYEPSI